MRKEIGRRLEIICQDYSRIVVRGKTFFDKDSFNNSFDDSYNGNGGIQANVDVDS